LKHYDEEFRVITVYGGTSIEDQTRELNRGVDIFVGTVGRVLDHIERGNIDFGHVKTIILDEADQMLNMGFKDDIERVTQYTYHFSSDHGHYIRKIQQGPPEVALLSNDPQVGPPSRPELPATQLPSDRSC